MSSTLSTPRVIRVLEEFLRNIQTPIPEIKSECDALLMECEKSNKWDTIIRDIISTLGEHDEKIAQRDESVILEGIEILPGIRLNEYWSSLGDKTKDAVWKYINLIMLAGVKYISSSKKKGVPSVSDGDDETERRKKFEEEIAERMKDPELREKMVEAIRKTIETSSETTPETTEETADMIKKFMEGVKETSIGKMVEEISRDLSGELTPSMLNLPEGSTLESMNLEDVLGLMGNSEVSSKIFGLVGKISDKINTRIQSGELSKEDLARESKEFLGKSKDLIGLLNPQAAAMMNSLGLGGVNGKQMKKAMKKATKMLETGTLPDISKIKGVGGGGSTRDRLRKKLEERRAAAEASVAGAATSEASGSTPTPGVVIKKQKSKNSKKKE